MGKLSKLRKDILRNPKEYRDTVKHRGIRIYYNKFSKKWVIYSSWSTNGYKNFVKSVLRKLDE